MPSLPQQKERHLAAQGKVTLPKGCQLDIELCYDGPRHIAALEQIDADQVTKFSAAKLEFDDSQLAHLKKFKNLVELNLDGTLVTEKSLPLIGSFPKLRLLRIKRTDITGSGFDALENVRQLAKLDLEGIDLKQGSLAKLRPLAESLTSLNVAKTGLTKVDMAAIEELHCLRRLDLSGNKLIDDNCAKYLPSLVNLNWLDITDTGITEKSLPDIYKLAKLRKVIMRNRQFWTSGHPQESKSGVKFQDAGADNKIPIEMFSPLH
jgi:hypothetical protein